MSSTNAHLLMRPGTVITKNTNGSGVSADGGTFTMSGGTISGNTATSANGGGVYVDGGTFTMKGGTIYGREAGTGLANTGSPGASLSIENTGATARYGNGSNILESGLATDETLVGHD
jgi:hypothetical protein